MKPVIGLLLIAGGIVLMYGLFTGKIVFPLGSPAPAASSSTSTKTGTTS